MDVVFTYHSNIIIALQHYLEVNLNKYLSTGLAKEFVHNLFELSCVLSKIEGTMGKYVQIYMSIQF